MSDQFSQLGAVTQIVSDTGEIEAIKKYRPVDATTNPSLIEKAAALPAYQHLVEDAVKYGVSKSNNDDEAVKYALDKLAVNFGTEITKLVPGLVSTEVDARLSFNTQATIDKALELIKLYDEAGVSKDRILIKIASTWEGIRAAEVLEKKHNIHCNMTLLFNLAQAAAAAEAGAYLISPFVGRISDWYKINTSAADYSSDKDPGVQSVVAIYRYYKHFSIPTIVMGASFRSKGQILALAGCDKLTIAPSLLEELKNSQDHVSRVLSPDNSHAEENKNHISAVGTDEYSFRWALNEDAMATEKLAEGIRLFAKAAVSLEKMLKEKITAHRH